MKIRPQINVTEPALDQNVMAALVDTVRINWTVSSSSINKVHIDYSTNNGQDWDTLDTNVTATNGTFYVWPLVPVFYCSLLWDNIFLRSVRLLEKRHLPSMLVQLLRNFL